MFQETYPTQGSDTRCWVDNRPADRFHRRRAVPDVSPGCSCPGEWRWVGSGSPGVGTGRLDIGLASRELTPLEQKRFEKAGLKVHAVGKDAVACVISSEIYHAGVRVLSREQIRDIYLGRITNWKAVGGPDRAIVVIDKERHRGTRHAFMQYVMNDPNARAPGARLVTGSNNEEQTKIAQSDSAIGMLSFAWMNSDVKGVAIQESSQLIEPTLDNVHNGRYPIVRNLNLITRGDLKGPARRYLEWVLGPEGQQLVRDSGYVAYTRSEGSHIVSRTPSP